MSRQGNGIRSSSCRNSRCLLALAVAGAAGLGRPAAAAIYYDDPNAITDFASLGSAWNPADVPGDTDGSYVFGGSFCGPFVVAPGGLEVSGLWCAATERVEARSPYRLSGMMTGHEADGGVGTSLPSVAGIGPSDIMIPNTNLLTSNRGLPGTAIFDSAESFFRGAVPRHQADTVVPPASAPNPSGLVPLAISHATGSSLLRDGPVVLHPSASGGGIATVVSSDGGSNAPFSGINIATYVGANTFYAAGYTGTRAVIANIEAGVAWNGHETLNQGQITQYFADPSITSQAGWSAATNAWTDMHATWVGQCMVGQGSQVYQPGIAYGAKLWSGAIATSWVYPGSATWSGSFNTTGASFTTPYYDAMVAGVNGQGTADVINSSWGSSAGQDGNYYYAVAIDAMAFTGGKTVCIAAGNSGPGTNTIGAPAAGFNALVVGATGPDTSYYSSIASFSSRSPTDVYDPSLGITISGARARVDIVAPGDNLTLAAYGGATGGNVFGGSTFSYTTYYSQQAAGTSFASPFVAACAALVVDAGKARYPTDAQAIDGRVIKAVLMNSASKLAGWNNGQNLVNGVITTTQSLDFNQGAGQINLTQAYTQYTAGTTDVPGLAGGSVQPTGWDYGRVAATSHDDFPITTQLTAGSTFSVTLDWFAHSVVDAVGLTAGYGAFDNLDLQVWTASGGVAQTLIAQSISKYNSAEHLYFSIPSSGNYLIRVLDAGFNWNGLNGITDTSTDFGLAWAWGGSLVSYGYTGATAGNWSDTTRWTTAAVPVAGEDVLLNSAATVTYDYSGANISLHSLTIDSGSTLTQSGQYLTSATETIGSTGVGTLSQSGGTHAIVGNLLLGANAGASGTFTLSGSGTFLAGALYAGGSDTAAGGAGVLTLNSSTASATVSGTLKIWNTTGSAVNLSAGTLAVGSLDTNGNPSRFNWTGGTLGITGAAGLALTATGPLGGTLSLASSRTLTVTNTLSTDSSTSLALTGGTLSAGIIALGGGTLAQSGGTLAAGTIQVNTGATFTQTSGAITGTGSLSIGGGTASLGAANTFTGGLFIKSGTVSGAGSTSAFGAATNVITIGDASGSANATLNGGLAGTFANPIAVAAGNTGSATITDSAASIFSGTLTLANNLTLAPAGSALALSGRVVGTGNLVLGTTGGGAITLSGSSINQTGSITNNGTGAGTTTISGVIGRNVSSVIENSGTALLTLSGANTFTSGLFIKAGTVSGITSTSAFGASSGVITIGDTSGSANATLSGGLAGTFANPITVAAGSTGTATITDTAASIFSGAITLNKNLTVAPAASALTLGGSIAGTGNLLLGTTGAGTLMLSGSTVNTTGSISNNASGGGVTTISAAIGSNVAGIIQNSGSSTLTLSGTNTYHGTTTVNSGVLKAGTTQALGVNSAVTLANVSGAILDITGYNTAIGSLTGGGASGGNITLGAATLTIGGDATSPAAYAGSISGTGSITKIGSGVLTLAGTNGYSGGTSLNAGTISVTADNNLGNVSGGLVFGGGSLLNGGGGSTAFATSRAITLVSGGGTLDTGTAGNTSLFSGTLTDGANLLTLQGSGYGTYNGAIGNGSGGLTKAGSGTWTLAGSNTYSGGTTISAGVLRLGSANALGTGGLILAGGTLDSAGGTITLASAPQTWNSDLTFQGSANLNMGAGTVTLTATRQATVDGGNLTIGGPIVGGTYGLTKAGGGTLTLSGSNTYTGTTTISGGVLVLGAGGSLASSKIIVGDTAADSAAALNVGGVTGGFHVAGGQTLAGHGIVLGGVTADTGSHLAPGNSIGTTTYDTLTLSNGTALDYDFGTANASHSPITTGSADLIAITASTSGSLVFPSGGQVTLNLASGGAFTSGHGTYELFSYVNSGAVLNFNGGDGATGSIRLSGFPTGTANSTTHYTLSNDTGNSGIFLDYVNNNSHLAFTPTTVTLTTLTTGTPGTSATLGNTQTDGTTTTYSVGVTNNGLTVTDPAGGALNAGNTSNFGLVLVGNNDNGSATSGTKTYTVTVANTSNTADTTATITVTANIYQPAALSTALVGGNLNLTNTHSSDGGQRAGATLNTISSSSSNFTVSLGGAPNVGIAGGSDVTATVATYSLAPNRLNGFYPGATATAAAQYTNGTLALQGTITSPTWNLPGTTVSAAQGVGQTFTSNIASGQKYSGYGLSSGTAGSALKTNATFLDSATATSAHDVTMSFTTRAAVPADSSILFSDMVTVGGVSDLVVLSMSYDTGLAGSQTASLFLGHEVGSAWVNAGNSSNPKLGAYVSEDLVLGYYGLDTNTHTVWAVVDSADGNGTFAVIPEPTSLGLLGLGALGLLARKRRT